MPSKVRQVMDPDDFTLTDILQANPCENEFIAHLYAGYRFMPPETLQVSEVVSHLSANDLTCIPFDVTKKECTVFYRFMDFWDYAGPLLDKLGDFFKANSSSHWFNRIIPADWDHVQRAKRLVREPLSKEAIVVASNIYWLFDGEEPYLEIQQ